MLDGEEMMSTDSGSVIERLRLHKGMLQVAEVASMLQVSQRTIYRAVKKRKMPGFVIGTAVRFDPQLLARWLEKQTTPRSRTY